MSDSWSKIEVALIVADYFDMLTKELNLIPYKKAEHRRQIFPLLNNRSEGSIEFKHQNISAILITLGRPYITGYLPRYNYQRLLEDEVIDYLVHHSEIESDFHQFAEKELLRSQARIDFKKIIAPPPESITVTESDPIYRKGSFKINYLEKEQSNKALGLYGEEIVIEYEKWNLIRTGKEKLAGKVQWISKEEGDWAGFDILSKNLNGTDKYIEVKTTKLGKETPFYFSSHELQFSIDKAPAYHLYRLFNAEIGVRLFQKNGALNTICKSVPTMYKGYF